jgi:hypothetical protein
MVNVVSSLTRATPRRLAKITWLVKCWKISQKHFSNRLAIYPTEIDNIGTLLQILGLSENE